MGRHTLIYFMGRGIPGVINFIAIMIYTRLLSPSDYGIYALVMVTITVLNLVFFQWIRQGLLRFLSAYSEKKSIFLSTVFITFLAIIIVMMILFVFLSPLFGLESENNLILLVGFLLLIALAWNEMNLSLLRASLLPEKFGIISMKRAVISLILAIMLIKLGLGSLGLIIGLLLGTIIPLIRVSLDQWRTVKLKLFNKTIAKKILNYGLPITLSTALLSVIIATDRWFLGWLIGTEEVGYYSVAYDFTQNSLLLLMSIINLSSYPIIIKKLENKGLDEARLELKKSFTYLIVIAIPATLAIMLLSPNIATVVFGSEFSVGAASIMPLLILAVFFNGMKLYYFDLSFQLGRSTRIQIIPVLAAAIINVVLNYLLIPEYGALGATIATLISYLFALIISGILAFKVFPLPIPLLELLKVIISTILMVAIIYPFKNIYGVLPLIIQVVVGIIAYSIFVIMFNIGGIRRTALEYFKRIKNKNKLSSI